VGPGVAPMDMFTQNRRGRFSRGGPEGAFTPVGWVSGKVYGTCKARPGVRMGTKKRRRRLELARAVGGGLRGKAGVSGGEVGRPITNKKKKKNSVPGKRSKESLKQVSRGGPKRWGLLPVKMRSAKIRSTLGEAQPSGGRH